MNLLIKCSDVSLTPILETPKYKSLHQLDSFNDLYSQKANGIKHIIKRANPLII